MFSLPEFTKVKILEVALLSSKNRPPGANPGVRLDVQADVPNYVLTEFDGGLRTALFTKSDEAASSAKDKRQTLPGVEEVSDLPNLTSIGRHVKKLSWSEKLTGYTATIDHGIGGASNLVLSDCVLENFRFAAKQGGTVTAWWSIEVVDVPKLTLAELSVLKSREVPLQLAEPEIRQQDLTEDKVFVNKPKGDVPEQEEGEVLWPFPNAAPGSPAAAANAKVSNAKAKGKPKAAKTPEEAFADTAKE